MAYTTINKSTDYFNTKLYTGNGSSSHGITGINFKPDWTWIKSRSNASDHILTDIVRGATVGIKSNTNAGNATDGNQLKSFDSDGFTLGSENDVNGSSRTYASWNWLAGGTAITGSGSLTNTRSTNTTAGFSIIKYTSTQTASSTIAHGLGSAPDFVLIKQLGGTNNWILWTTPLGATTNYMYPNTTGAMATSTDWIGVDATNITLKTTWGELNITGDFICYAWKAIQGFSAFGKYTGNGNADGTFVYTGFKPAFIMVKRTDNTSSWQINDNKRDVDNVQNTPLMANLSNAESTDTSWDALSNGFKMRQSYGSKNASGGSYIYMAFAEAPLVGTNNVPCTAR